MLAQLEDGFIVTLMGMGVVFVLLTLLVWVVLGMSRLARFIEGAPAPVTVTGAPGAAADEEIVSAIGAAIAAYRQKHRR
jgi:sodium pump decarboxylase gamma subunit